MWLFHELDILCKASFYSAETDFKASLGGSKSMADDAQTLESRKAQLVAEISDDRVRYLQKARINYYGAQVLSWGSIAAASLAAVLGVIPYFTVDKTVVGVLAALSPALVAASQKLGLQRKANWHYRKLDRLRALERRLQFELPISTNAENIAAISSALSALDSSMSKEWEDMQHDPVEPRQTEQNP